MSLEANKAVVRRFIEEVWNNRELDSISAQVLLPRFQAPIHFYHYKQPRAASQVRAYDIARPVRAHVNTRYSHKGYQQSQNNGHHAAQQAAPEQHISEKKEKAEILDEENDVTRWKAFVTILNYHINQRVVRSRPRDYIFQQCIEARPQ